MAQEHHPRRNHRTRSTKSADSELTLTLTPACSKSSEPTCPSRQSSPFVIESPVCAKAGVHPQPPLPLQSPVQGIDRVAARPKVWRRETRSRAIGKNRSQICAQAGIYAASVALRHSSAPCARGVARRPRSVAESSRCPSVGSSKWPNAVWQTAIVWFARRRSDCSMNCWSGCRHGNFPQRK